MGNTEPVLEIALEQTESPDNPYKAIVVCNDDGYESGRVRIEPPFTPSEDYLAMLQDNVDVELVHRYTTLSATMLGFYVRGEFGHFTDQERVDATIRNLLSDLGHAANPQSFKQDL